MTIYMVVTQMMRFVIGTMKTVSILIIYTLESVAQRYLCERLGL